MRTRPAGHIRLVLGRLRVTTRITGLRAAPRAAARSCSAPTRSSCRRPRFETTGVWLELPTRSRAALQRGGRALHGRPPRGRARGALALPALRALRPLRRRAASRRSRTRRSARAAIFLYDGAPGGHRPRDEPVGARRDAARDDARARARVPLRRGLPLVRPLAEAAAAATGRSTRPRRSAPLELAARARTAAARSARAGSGRRRGGAVGRAGAAVGAAPLFFDVETQKSAEEVGGWHNAHLMRVALAVIWDRRTGASRPTAKRRRRRCSRGSARPTSSSASTCAASTTACCAPTPRRDLGEARTFDLLDAIRDRIGYRLSLDHLAEQTLGAAKTADGLQALAWWREGRIDQIERYCRRDVELLRELFERSRAGPPALPLARRRAAADPDTVDARGAARVGARAPGRGAQWIRAPRWRIRPSRISK